MKIHWTQVKLYSGEVSRRLVKDEMKRAEALKEYRDTDTMRYYLDRLGDGTENPGREVSDIDFSGIDEFLAKK